ncbi:MAG: gamma-glutamylcyclotransferase family protein, partial [Gammaproteobacteria bacterium]
KERFRPRQNAAWIGGLGWHNSCVNADMDLALFVYGSLKPGATNWKRYCEHHVAELQPARVRGRLYKFSDGYLALGEPAGRRQDPWVRGWRLVLRSEEALWNIDRLEDYDSTKPLEENVYLRVRVACFDDEEKSTEPAPLGEAWVYTVTPARLAFEGAVEISPT